MIRRVLPGALIFIAGAVDAQPPISIPLVGCETGGQISIETPKSSRISVRIPAAIAKKLAYYNAGNGLAVLAPRRWHCFGTVGSGGDQLFVTPEAMNRDRNFSNAWPGFQGPIVQLTRVSGGAFGRFSVAKLISWVFPDRRSFAESVEEESPGQRFPSGTYPGDKLLYKSKTVVEYTTPPHTDGLGTYEGLKKNDSQVDGVAILIDQATPDVLLLSVRLKPSFAVTVSTIVSQVERDAAHGPQ